MGNGGVLGAKVVYVVVGGVLPLTLTPSTVVCASSRTYCPKKDAPLAVIV